MRVFAGEIGEAENPGNVKKLNINIMKLFDEMRSIQSDENV